jgi:hypothetical protein
MEQRIKSFRKITKITEDKIMAAFKFESKKFNINTETKESDWTDEDQAYIDEQNLLNQGIADAELDSIDIDVFFNDEQ